MVDKLNPGESVVKDGVKITNIGEGMMYVGDRDKTRLETLMELLDRDE